MRRRRYFRLPFPPRHAGCSVRINWGLDLPTSDPTDKDGTVLVWGGSTSVGCNAVQLAKAAGYRVVSTASPRNFNYLKGLGADEVHDYNGADAVTRITRALRGHKLAGALAIGAGSARACIAVLGASEGNRKMAVATFPVDIDAIPDRPNAWTMMTRMVPQMMMGAGGMWDRRKNATGVRLSSIWGSALMDTDLGPAIYERFLPEALRSGQFCRSTPTAGRRPTGWRPFNPRSCVRKRACRRPRSWLPFDSKRPERGQTPVAMKQHRRHRVRYPRSVRVGPVSNAANRVLRYSRHECRGQGYVPETRSGLAHPRLPLKQRAGSGGDRWLRRSLWLARRLRPPRDSVIRQTLFSKASRNSRAASRRWTDGQRF